MTAETDRKQLVNSLLRPSAYPHDVSGDVLHISTHISDVFLAGEFAYKVKKPVNFGFCDFSTADLRERFTSLELELNQRLSSGVYLSIEPVTHDVRTGEFAIGGSGSKVETALKMRRLSTDDQLDVLITQGRAGDPEIRQIAQLLARSHSEATAAGEKFGTVEAVAGIVLGNLDRVFEHAQPELNRISLANIAAYAEAFLAVRGGLISKRRAADKPRMCHGDLHAGNIFLERTGERPGEQSSSALSTIQVIDCIEFNPSFVNIDPAADLAFLSMDLKRLGHETLAENLVKEYVTASGDNGIGNLMPFYESYRAMVRCMAESIMAGQESGDGRTAHVRAADAYLELACQQAQRDCPQFLAITSGVTGTGKSTAARIVADNWNAVHLQSDAIRRELAGIGPTERSGSGLSGGIYTKEMSLRTYEEMQSRGAQALVEGRSVILDGTHTRADFRAQSLDIGRQAGVMTLVIECSMPEKSAIDRLKRRYASGQSESEGRPEVYQRQIAGWQPVSDAEADAVVRVSTEGESEDLPGVLFPALWKAVLSRSSRH